MKETNLVRGCLTYLRTRGIFAWRNNSGATKVGGRMVRFGARGSPDIIGVLPDGRFLAVECKTGRRKLTPEQAAFLDRVAECGGVTVVARTIDDLHDGIQAALYDQVS